MNLNTQLLNDNQETRKEIRTQFCKSYNINPKNHSDDECFEWEDKDSDEVVINTIGKTIIENIDSEKENSNTLFHKILMFVFLQLDKVTYSEKEKIDVISKENMPRNFNEIELNNFKLIFDEIILFIQILAENSSLSKSETDDWDLDMINFSKVFFSSESIRFDNNISGYEHLIGKANEIRNNEDKN